MRHTLLDPLGSSAFVTAYGTTANYCKLYWWGPSGNDTEVDIACYNGAGAALEAAFIETFARNEVRGPC